VIYKVVGEHTGKGYPFNDNRKAALTQKHLNSL